MADGAISGAVSYLLNTNTVLITTRQGNPAAVLIDPKSGHRLP